MKMYAPVIIFVYKRPQHTRATIEALARNTLAAQTNLVIFSDGARSQSDWQAVEEVRRIVRATEGFASLRLVEREKNMGLSNSVIAGVTEILGEHDKVIVLEDDLVSSPHFLSYMNDALENYREDPRVFSVTGHTFPASFMPIPRRYQYDTYAGHRCSSWSWGTWPDRWRRVDWKMEYFESFNADPAAQEEFNRGGQDMTTLLRMQHEHQIDSWAIRFCFAHYAHDMRCIYPVRTLIRNIGLDNSGTHSRPDPRFLHATLDESWVPRRFCSGAQLDPEIAGNFRAIFDSPRDPFSRRLFGRIRSGMGVVVQNGKRLGKKLGMGLVKRRETVDVLVVNTYQNNGGAARAAYRIFCGVRHHYGSARFLALFKEGRDPNVDGLVLSSVKGLLAQKLIRLDQWPLSRYPKRPKIFFSPAYWANPLRLPLKRYRANLVHLHWVGHGMLRVEELARLRGPVVWTLHDAWAFTGGCHYAGACEGFVNQCGACAQLGSHEENDLSRRLMRRKGRAYKNIDMTIVTPSRWLAEVASKSSLFSGKRIEVIPNGLDTESFKPIAQHVAREYLNLAPNRPVVLFGAHWIPDPRKGGDLLSQALARLNMPCTLLTFGEGQLSLDAAAPVTVRALGALADDVSLAMAYSAADVFVCPSREDNLPNTVAEALACGTPCVAFDVNGLPDMIDHQKNGWLARPFDSAHLAEGISWVVGHPQPEELRRAARQKALSEYSLDVMQKRYVALYSDLLR